jgi:hypothetical protein
MDGILIVNFKYLSLKFIQTLLQVLFAKLQNTHLISTEATVKLHFCRLFREVQQTLATTIPYFIENSRQP